MVSPQKGPQNLNMGTAITGTSMGTCGYITCWDLDNVTDIKKYELLGT